LKEKLVQKTSKNLNVSSTGLLFAKNIVILLFALALVLSLYFNFSTSQISTEFANRPLSKLIESLFPEVVGGLLVSLVSLFYVKYFLSIEIEKINSSNEIVKLSPADDLKSSLREFMINDAIIIDYVAYCENTNILCEERHRRFELRMKSFIGTGKDTMPSRVAKMRTMAQLYAPILGQITDEIQTLDQGDLIKMWLDVEIGGVFFYSIPKVDEDGLPSRFLFLATLDQAAMNDGRAHRQVENLFETVRYRAMS
jgi:hypothetical protein